MLLSTTPTLEGHQIQQYLGLVSGEVIIGANFIKDFTASLHDFFGGRSSSYEQTLIEAKEAALKEMSERAARLGANAIVGIDLDYEAIGKSFLGNRRRKKLRSVIALTVVSRFNPEFVNRYSPVISQNSLYLCFHHCQSRQNLYSRLYNSHFLG